MITLDSLMEAIHFDAKHGALTLRQVALLFVLDSCTEPWLTHDLAMALDVPKPSISRALDKLSICGLAKRLSARQMSDDKHTNVYVALTDKGRALLTQVKA